MSIASTHTAHLLAQGYTRQAATLAGFHLAFVGASVLTMVAALVATLLGASRAPGADKQEPELTGHFLPISPAEQIY
jgi:hypothetical protein